MAISDMVDSAKSDPRFKSLKGDAADEAEGADGDYMSECLQRAFDAVKADDADAFAQNMKDAINGESEPE